MIPAKNIKVYIDFISLLKSDPKIKKASIVLEELDIAQLNKLSIILKPSNLKNLINRIKGKIISEIDFFNGSRKYRKFYSKRGSKTTS